MTFILLFRFNKRNRLKPGFKTSCMIGLVQSKKLCFLSEFEKKFYGNLQCIRNVEELIE